MNRSLETTASPRPSENAGADGGQDAGRQAESDGALEGGRNGQRGGAQEDGRIGDGGSVPATLRAFFRRWKFWILLACILLLVVLVPFLARSAGTDTGILSPNNPAPEGAMAVAEILRSQGVEVRHTETLEETLAALAAAPQASTLLLHDRLQLLGTDQLRQLADAEARKVLIEPSVPILDALAANIDSAGVVPAAETGTLSPSCSLDDAVAAGPITRGGQVYRGPRMCYLLDGPGQNDSGQNDSASYVQNRNGSVVVLGNGSIFGNGRLAQAGNAALALRTLGSAPLLVWYQPTLADVALADQPPTLGELVPPWVNLTLIWLAVVAVLAMLWKGRRDGPLITEPLPVWAKASETAEGRARLYQDSRAVERTVENLRSAALVRMAQHLRMGAGVSAAQIARAAAQHSAAAGQYVQQVLLQDRPATDADLLRWARQLEALEKEVTAR